MRFGEYTFCATRMQEGNANLAFICKIHFSHAACNFDAISMGGVNAQSRRCGRDSADQSAGSRSCGATKRFGEITQIIGCDVIIFFLSWRFPLIFVLIGPCANRTGFLPHFLYDKSNYDLSHRAAQRTQHAPLYRPRGLYRLGCGGLIHH